MTDESLCCPTNQATAGLVPQAVVEKPGRVEKFATKSADMLGYMTAVPYIGKYAEAMSHVSMGAAKVAALFGWSKPPQSVKNPMVPRTTDELATYDGQDDIYRLVLDSKQALSIDPAMAGIPRIDELASSQFIMRESFLTSFNWEQLDTEGDQLFSVIVDPCIFRFEGSEPRAFGLAPMGMLALTHQAWTGSMKFRFEVVCSAFHRGRLRIVYDPFGNPDDEFNTNYSTIVDIGSNKCTTIDVGWAQPTAFRRCMPIDYTKPSYVFGKDTLYTSDTTNYGNGTLSVFVVNDLTSPLDVSTIQVNVFISGGDDMKFCGPTGEKIKNITYMKPPSPNLSPQSSEEHSYVQFAHCQQPKQLINGYYGETTVSVRQLLKRYQYYMTDYTAVDGSTSDWAYYKSSLPLYPMPRYAYDPGLTGGAITPFDRAVTAFPTYNMTPVSMSYFSFFAPAFAGVKGGMRWMYEDIVYTNGSSADSRSEPRRVYMSRGEPFYPFDRQASDFAIGRYYDRVAGPHLLPATMSGFSLQDPHLNPVNKVEIPFYSNLKFSTSGTRGDFLFGLSSPTSEALDTLDTLMVHRDNGVVDQFAYSLYHSIGEDFNLLWFQQVPKFYFLDILELNTAPAP
jgi:hypothetical protein